MVPGAVIPPLLAEDTLCTAEGMLQPGCFLKHDMLAPPLHEKQTHLLLPSADRQPPGPLMAARAARPEQGPSGGLSVPSPTISVARSNAGCLHNARVCGTVPCSRLCTPPDLSLSARLAELEGTGSLPLHPGCPLATTPGFSARQSFFHQLPTGPLFKQTSVILPRCLLTDIFITSPFSLPPVLTPQISYSMSYAPCPPPQMGFSHVTAVVSPTTASKPAIPEHPFSHSVDKQMQPAAQF